MSTLTGHRLLICTLFSFKLHCVLTFTQVHDPLNNYYPMGILFCITCKVTVEIRITVNICYSCLKEDAILNISKSDVFYLLLCILSHTIRNETDIIKFSLTCFLAKIMKYTDSHSERRNKYFYHLAKIYILMCVMGEVERRSVMFASTNLSERQSVHDKFQNTFHFSC